MIPWSSVLLEPSNVMLSRGNDVSMLVFVIATGGVFCSRIEYSSITKSTSLSHSSCGSDGGW